MPDGQDKDIAWVGSSKADLSAFPKDAKSRAGHELRRVQQGRNPDHWRPMPDVGQGVAEIIIDTGDAFRVFYVARFADAVYVLHAFQKNTQKTAKRDIDLGKKRYREIVESINAQRVKSRKKRRS